MSKFSSHRWVILLFALVALCACGSKDKKEETRAQRTRTAPKVDGYIVALSTLVNQITVSGSILPFEEVELKNEVPGRIVLLNLPEGKFVREGTLLVKLFNDDLQANLTKLETQLKIQEQILQRQNELLKVNGISQTEFDQASLSVNSIKAEIEVVKAQIRKTQILAPFDGVIGLRKISPGAVVPTSTPLATIRQESKLKLDFNVPEKYSRMVAPGMNVSFTVQGDITVHSASVMATEKGIETSTRNLRVRAVIDQPSASLIAGAYANVQLLLEENPNALLIPTNALIPSERSKSVIVARQGKAHFVEVQTGIRSTGSIEILSGVQLGDTVITSGILFLKEGMKLGYSEIKTGSL